MEVPLSTVLSLIGAVLAMLFLVFMGMTWKDRSKYTYVIKVALSFLLVCENIANGMLGNQLSWLLVVLWSISFVINLVMLSI